MRSAIYQGRVQHVRLRPRRHAFSYRLFMLYLDLAELDRVFAGRWLWSGRRPAPAWFRRRDHFGDPQRPLAECVRSLVASRLGSEPRGPIRLLTHLRYWGYCINPISIYYCFDEADRQVQAMVAEVTNTPWGERVCYVLPGPARGQGFTHPKGMHVSPFMPMDHHYEWHCSEPGEALRVAIANHDAQGRLFHATLSLKRRPLDGRGLAAVLLTHPFMTGKVAAAIYWQALLLKLKGIPYVPHPGKLQQEVGE